jgi:hypothetical protein
MMVPVVGDTANVTIAADVKPVVLLVHVVGAASVNV